ncbi:MAG: AraC family transcriptional regulator [Kiritimatiellae bacterium]|nr:AraC family transcriptional regulator [Kiritimatiellia bacterium]
MHKTFAHISVATESEIGLPDLFTQVDAHEETWEAGTLQPQVYETTIEYQLAGSDRRWIAGREYRTEAGALSVFAAGSRIEAERIPPGKFERVTYLRIRGPLAAAIERTLEIAPDRPLILPDAPSHYALSLAQATKTVFERPPNWAWRLVELLAELTRTLATAHQRPPLPTARLVDRVRTLVEESPNRPWSVKELSAVFDVRREVLWGRFKEQTGQSPGDWIRQHRIRIAREMLDRGLSVRQTAERLGFSSRQQFARSYRSVTGQAPSTRGS